MARKTAAGSNGSPIAKSSGDDDVARCFDAPQPNKAIGPPPVIGRNDRLDRDGAEPKQDDNARQAFANLVARITALVQEALSEGAEPGEFNGDPAIAALHTVTATRGLALME